MKEQIRGEIQANLERLALGCRDLASLLRRLQIPVEGGVFPSPQQVAFSPCDHLIHAKAVLSWAYICSFVQLMSSSFEHIRLIDGVDLGR